jgi:ABC-type Fe3+/spermidine/putrescine transport system ATPase subunit
VTLEARGLIKTYGRHAAVADFTHTFEPGAITTVVGASGSGKSTTLWMLAGLTHPDEGSLYLEGVDITRVPAEERGFGMVFQSYALFPHLSVRENVEFGLRVRGIRKPDRRARAYEALELTRTQHLAERRTSQLSGGEQQRVALARALVIRPRVLLLDEPLSALDARLREELRGELYRLLGALKITTIYVTHDQLEAMSLGRTLIVMEGGKIQQSGAPSEVYRRPASKRVAEFLGAVNIFAGQCVGGEGGGRIKLPFATLTVPHLQGAPGRCWAMIRPEDLSVATTGRVDFHALPESVLFVGNQKRVHMTAEGCKVIMDVPNEIELHSGQPLPVRVKSEKIYTWSRAENEDERQML